MTLRMVLKFQDLLSCKILATVKWFTVTMAVKGQNLHFHTKNPPLILIACRSFLSVTESRFLDTLLLGGGPDAPRDCNAADCCTVEAGVVVSTSELTNAMLNAITIHVICR